MAKEGFAVLVIDAQNDFHGGGSLAVAGADEDSARVAEFIEAKTSKISALYTTLDSHHKEHIAHSVFWSSTADGTGEGPAPFTMILSQDIEQGKWFPKDPTLKEYCLEYSKQLEAKGRFKIIIWPQHCIIGSKGQEIVASIQGAINDWERTSGKKCVNIYKGMNNLTEMYSAIEAEVSVPADVQTQANHAFLDQLKEARKLYICGQALSHCVNYTTRDILKYWAPRDPKDLVVLSDGCSAVTGFQEAADAFLSDMKAAGVTVKTIAEAMQD